MLGNVIPITKTCGVRSQNPINSIIVYNIKGISHSTNLNFSFGRFLWIFFLVELDYFGPSQYTNIELSSTLKLWKFDKRINLDINKKKKLGLSNELCLTRVERKKEKSSNEKKIESPKQSNFFPLELFKLWQRSFYNPKCRSVCSCNFFQRWIKRIKHTQ